MTIDSASPRAPARPFHAKGVIPTKNENDTFGQCLHELGEEIFGEKWLILQHRLNRWLRDEPEKAQWLRHRVRDLVWEGRI